MALLEVRNSSVADRQLLDELQHARERLAEMPYLGPIWRWHRARRFDVRKYLLTRTGYWVYYTVDERHQLIVIRSIWHGARGGPPPI